VSRNRPMLSSVSSSGAEGSILPERAPANRPPWIETAVLSFPSAEPPDESSFVTGLVRPAVLGGQPGLHRPHNPHPVRSDDRDHPDELRIEPRPDVRCAVVARSARWRWRLRACSMTWA